MERKSIALEVKDLDKDKRTAIIAHATYDSVDRVDDIIRKGAFTKSWNESKSDISLYLNHDDTLSPGRVDDVYEDNQHAYTKAYFGTHTLGNDTLLMLDEKVVKYASFGYIAGKSNPLKVKDKTVRELKELVHIETSPLTKMPAHPNSRVISVTKAMVPELKSLTQPEFAVLKQISIMDNDCLRMMMQLAGEVDTTSDLYNWILWQISRRADAMGSIRSQLQYNAPEIKAMKEHIETMERFCRDTKASDDCIKSVLGSIEETKSILATYEQEEKSTEVVEDKSDYTKKLLLLSAKMSLRTFGATG